MAVNMCLIICVSIVVICLICSIESIITNKNKPISELDCRLIMEKLDSIYSLLKEVLYDNKNY